MNYIVICPHMNNRQNSAQRQYNICHKYLLIISLFNMDILRIKNAYKYFINDQSMRDLSNQNAFFDGLYL